MNYVDLIVILMAVSSAVHGVFQGAAVQVLSFGGFWAGLLLGATVAPTIAGFFETAPSKAMVTVFVLFGTASVVAGVGRRIGTRVWDKLRGLRLGFADSALGAVTAGGATLLAAWLVASMLATVPLPAISQGIQRSRVLMTMDEVMPPAPSVFARLRNLFNTAGFPDVFAGLEPSPAPGVPIPDDATVQAAVENAGPSTVKVVHEDCGGITSGSGFVAGDGLVVTNAHVVAGAQSVRVEDRGGSHRASVVLFDPDLDIAVLRASGLAGPPLALHGDRVGRGEQAAVLGYPRGGGFTAGPAAVRDQFTAVGRDIYGQKIVRRPVYQLQAQVVPGNSGGPLARPNGEVIGVIFAASAYGDDTGYAITSDEVIPKLQAARGAQAADTQRCAA